MTLQETRPETQQLPPSNENGPDTPERWASEAPLKLVAWALDGMGRKAKSAAIREKLEGRFVRDPGWETWWKRVLPAVKESSQFDYRTPADIRLTTGVDNVESPTWESLASPTKAVSKKPATATDWRKWFLGNDDGPPPGAYPTKIAVNALARLSVKDIRPAKDIRGALEKALEKILGRTENFLGSDIPTPQPTAGWAAALSQGFCRLREVSPDDPDRPLSGRVGEMLGRLFKIAADASELAELVPSMASKTDYLGDVGVSVLAAADMPGLPHPWKPDFINGMWQGLEDPFKQSGNLFEAGCRQLNRDDLLPLARELIEGTLQSSGPNRRYSYLDDILVRFAADERFRFLRELMLRAANGEMPKEEVLAYIHASRYAGRLSDSPQRLDLLVMASLLLTDGQHDLTRQAAHEIGQVLTDPTVAVNSPVWDGLLTPSRQRIAELQTPPRWQIFNLLTPSRRRMAELRAQHQQELEQTRQSHQRQLEECQVREDNLNGTVEMLRAQIAEGREKSKMDILEDTVTVITETLREFRQSTRGPEETLRHIDANLTLALRVGGAEEFGRVGETVPFDPTRHEATDYIPIQSPVRISIPGAIMPGKSTGDRILLKAFVESAKEVS